MTSHEGCPSVLDLRRQSMTNESKDMLGAGGGALAILTTATLGGGGACCANDDSETKTFLPTAAVVEIDCITAVRLFGTWSKLIGEDVSPI